MDNDALTRQHEPRRPTRWALTVAFSLCAGGAIAGAAWATWLGGSEPEPRVVTVPVPTPAEPVQPEVVVVEPKCPTPPPAPVVVVQAAPDPRFGPGSCPGRDASKDPAIGTTWEDFQAGGDDTARVLDPIDFIGVDASVRKHGHLAAWTRESIYYSNTDGRKFREVLRGPGQIYDALVDCRGAVFVLRGTEHGFLLGYAHRREQWWRPLTMRDTELSVDDQGEVSERGFGSVSLAAGGGWLAITAPGSFFGLDHYGSYHAIAVTRDGAATWSYLPIPNEGLIEYADVVSIDDDGRLRMLGQEGDCMYDGASLHTFQLPSGKARFHTQLSTTKQMHPTITGRWAYHSEACDKGPLCALELRRPRSADWQEPSWLPVAGMGPDRRGADDAEQNDEDIEREASVFANGRVYARHGDTIFRLRGRKAMDIADDVPAQVGFAVMDSSHRLLGLSRDGKLVRWSLRHGVRVLRGQVGE